MLIPTFVPIPTYPVRVAQKELPYFLKQVRRYARSYAALIILLTILVHLILWMIISPELLELYPYLRLRVPAYLGPAFMLIPPVLGLGLLSYLLLIDPLAKQEVLNLLEDKSDFVPIKSSLINGTVSTFPIIYMVFVIMFLILTLIMPIYNINFLI